jgi:hypothetical protein
MSIDDKTYESYWANSPSADLTSALVEKIQTSMLTSTELVVGSLGEISIIITS